MRVTVQLFARLRELAGGAEWTIDVPPGSTVRDVWRTLAATHPPLATFDAAVSAALNERFTAQTAEVREGDAIAFLPPVSGGTDLDVQP